MLQGEPDLAIRVVRDIFNGDFGSLVVSGDEAWDTIQRVREFPLAWHPMGGAVRRCQMHRFPYGIIYEPTQIEIVVIAVAHLHQAPEYWRARV